MGRDLQADEPVRASGRIEALALLTVEQLEGALERGGYRLLDPTNTRKSIDSLLALLQVLECEVDLVVRAREA